MLQFVKGVLYFFLAPGLSLNILGLLLRNLVLMSDEYIGFREYGSSVE